VTNQGLKELYNRLIAEGCNRFYIDGIGGPHNDDVECLGFQNGEWLVYYTERGQVGHVLFRSDDQQKAIDYYYRHVMSMEHWHLAVMTRSKEVVNEVRKKLEKRLIKTIQNDIPSYSKQGDVVFRLFVTGKDVFQLDKVLDEVPLCDPELK
jgi:hypothetical protein